MKFGKLSVSNVSQEAASFGGAVLGAAVSYGAIALVPAEQKQMAQIGMTAGGIVLASVVKGKSTADVMLKLSGIGIAVKQGLNLLRDFAADKVTVDSSSMASKFVGGTVGLACPCEQGLNFPGLKLTPPSLNFNSAVMPKQLGINKSAAGAF